MDRKIIKALVEGKLNKLSQNRRVIRKKEEEKIGDTDGLLKKE